MIFTVTNIDGVVKEFGNNHDFIQFAADIFSENEENDVFVARYCKRPADVESAEHYINTYCDNLTLEIA